MLTRQSVKRKEKSDANKSLRKLAKTSEQINCALVSELKSLNFTGWVDTKLEIAYCSEEIVSD